MVKQDTHLVIYKECHELLQLLMHQLTNTQGRFHEYSMNIVFIMFTLRSSIWRYAITLLLLVLQQTHAFTIHQNCYDQGMANRVQLAIEEAVNIANYAKYRVQQRFPAWDASIFNALMPSENTFLCK